MSIKLDTKDKKILYELDMDARQSNSSIAKKVGLSKEVVNYRIKRLEKDGIIENYYAILNIQKLGYMYCRFLITLHNITPEDEENFIEELKKDKRVGWIILIQGEWDLALVMWAKRVAEIKQFSNELMYKYGRFIKEKEVTIATKVYHFKLRYLYDIEDNNYRIVGGDIKEEKVDDIDLKILGILANNGRESTVEIANKLKISANSVKYRTKNLLGEGVILGFRAAININKLGYHRYKVFLFLENFDEGKIKKIISYLSFERNIIYITEAVGRADLEFEIDVKDNIELYNRLKKIRMKFSEIIKDYQMSMTIKEVGINYLPEMKTTF